MASCGTAFLIALMASGFLLTSCQIRLRTTTIKLEENVTKPFNCSLEHRKHPTSENMFQKKWNNGWKNYTCPVSGLVWNQDTCRCEQGNDYLDPCAEYSPVPGSPKSYIRTVWGRNFSLTCGSNMVWSQEECTCRFAEYASSAGAASDPCEVMFNATFDKAFEDHARGSYIGRYPFSGAKVERKSGSVGGGSVCLNKGYITVPAFDGNEMSKIFQVQFRVKMGEEKEKDPLNRFDILLSNGCGRDNATLEIGYRRSDRIFSVSITDRFESVSLTCSDRGPSNEWKRVSLQVTNQKILLTVNGRICIEDESSIITEQPIPTRCPLSFGGDSRRASKIVTGCFDEIVVRRYCIE